MKREEGFRPVEVPETETETDRIMEKLAEMQRTGKGFAVALVEAYAEGLTATTKLEGTA